MASTKHGQFTARPNYTPTHQGAPGRPTRLLAIVAIVGGSIAFFISGPGVSLLSTTFRFLAFYSGVFSLVALSLTVMGGLAATDRIVLMVRHRVLLQAVHRAMATASMVFLAIHILTKIAQGHATVVDVIVPFLASHRAVYIGLGTIASYLMIGLTMTGIMRGRFAGTSRPWLWRALHSPAYLCWPIALLHGLDAGRVAKSWVTVSYTLCMVLVGLALVVRVWVIWGRHLRSPHTQTTATLRPVGRMAPVEFPAPQPAEPASRSRRRRRLRRAQPRQPSPATQSSPASQPSPAAPFARRFGRPAGRCSYPTRSRLSALPAVTARCRRPTNPSPESPAPTTVGRWQNTGSDTITDEEFWTYLRNELR